MCPIVVQKVWGWCSCRLWSNRVIVRRSLCCHRSSQSSHCWMTLLSPFDPPSVVGASLSFLFCFGLWGKKTQSFGSCVMRGVYVLRPVFLPLRLRRFCQICVRAAVSASLLGGSIATRCHSLSSRPPYSGLRCVNYTNFLSCFIILQSSFIVIYKAMTYGGFKFLVIFVN